MFLDAQLPVVEQIVRNLTEIINPGLGKLAYLGCWKTWQPIDGMFRFRLIAAAIGVETTLERRVTLWTDGDDRFLGLFDNLVGSFDPFNNFVVAA